MQLYGCASHFTECQSCKGNFCKFGRNGRNNNIGAADALSPSFQTESSSLVRAIEEAEAEAFEKNYPAPAYNTGCRRMITCQKCEAKICVNCEKFRKVSCQHCNKQICKWCQGAGKCQLCDNFKCIDCDPVIFCVFCSISSCQSCCKTKYCGECKLYYCTSSRCESVHLACHSDTNSDDDVTDYDVTEI